MFSQLNLIFSKDLIRHMYPHKKIFRNNPVMTIFFPKTDSQYFKELIPSYKSFPSSHLLIIILKKIHQEIFIICKSLSENSHQWNSICSLNNNPFRCASFHHPHFWAFSVYNFLIIMVIIYPLSTSRNSCKDNGRDPVTMLAKL